jgi:hypothetical protein
MTSETVKTGPCLNKKLWQVQVQVQVQVCFTSVCGQVQPLDVALSSWQLRPTRVAVDSVFIVARGGTQTHTTPLKRCGPRTAQCPLLRP